MYICPNCKERLFRNDGSYYCKNKHDEIKMAINKAKELSGSTRVAILSLQDDLFKQFLCKDGEIYTPVAPDMTTV